MSRVLLLSVRFYDGRYHGVPDWPPSPARLFQALVAGAARGASLDQDDVKALRWLESLAAPTICAPTARRGSAVTSYVPNNDLDAVGRDPGRTAEIRAAKLIRPQLFDPDVPLLYLWAFKPGPEAEVNAARLCAIAERLFQLGRGVDMAWAVGEIWDADQTESRIAAHRGPIHRPAKRIGDMKLACPDPGSLASLIARHEANARRFSEIREAAPTAKDPNKTRLVGTAFAQPPKPRFRQVAYDCAPELLLLDLSGVKSPWRLERITELVETIRDASAAKLKKALEDAGLPEAALVDAVFIGRGATETDKAARIRIVPLPSIGHPKTPRGVRRVLVEVPPNCPIGSDEIAWAFSGLGAEAINQETGEVFDIWRLAPAEDRKMLRHYGVEPPSTSTLWRSVTPLALPERARRRRIDPARLEEESLALAASRTEAKAGNERAEEERRASGVAAAALRHAGVSAPAFVTAVQREPFEARGARAEAFATPPRFHKERLWHAEIRFAEPVAGLLTLGDGRYLGLGLMAPVVEAPGVLSFKIVSGLQTPGAGLEVTRALRRAVMARVQALHGGKSLPTYFSGHQADGAPARSGRHEHLAFVFDSERQRLLIISPHLLERRRQSASERTFWRLLVEAVSGFHDLRAGKAGLLRLTASFVDTEDPVVAASRIWRSATPYRVMRHRRRASVEEMVRADIIFACTSIDLPVPSVSVFPCSSASGGVVAHAQLEFRSAVRGPLILGASRHFGGGLFVLAGMNQTSLHQPEAR